MVRIGVVFFLLIVLFSCNTSHERVSEEEAKQVVEEFFEALNVDNKNRLLFYNVVTDDFRIYELGNEYNKEEFGELIESFGNVVETQWKLGDWVVSSDVNSAHVSLKNTGKFILETDSGNVTQHVEWLESAYLVKVNDSLKIKFYFSDNIKRELE